MTAMVALPLLPQAQVYQTDAQRERLNGHVQTIRETTYGTKGQELRMSGVCHFSIIGNYSRFILEDTAGTPQVAVCYFYDSMGVLAREGRFSVADSSLLQENTYSRDWHNNTVTMNILGVQDSLDEVMVYNYDDKGRLIRLSTLDGQGNLLSKDFYTYNDKGYCTEIMYTEGPNESYCRTERFRYDCEGNVIECRTLCISTERQRLCYTYDFDPYGNWVKKYVYDLKGKSVSLLQTVTREITYYE